MEAERSLCTASGDNSCPFLRPHFVTRRQEPCHRQGGACRISAIDRMGRDGALATPNLLNRHGVTSGGNAGRDLSGLPGSGGGRQAGNRI